MDLLKFWKRRTDLALVSAAAGAALAFLTIGITQRPGVPKLWSQEAAGWASAVGTILAVVVALGLAVSDSRRRRCEAVDRARGLSILLFPALQDWQQSVALLAHRVKDRRAMAITESFEPEGGDVLRVPEVLSRFMDRIHELGRPSIPLSRAVVGAEFCRRAQTAVREALRPNAPERDDVLDAFEANLRAVSASLSQAIEQLGNQLHAAKR